MGITSGPPRKPPGEGAKPHKAMKLASVSPLDAVPALVDQADMLAATRKAWTGFWRSPVAATIVQGSDLPALTRMFHLSDELERCRREFRKQRIVEGSQGQMVINPLGPLMLAISKEVRALEDRFGASVVSRLRLSIDLNSAQNSLEAMNLRMMATENGGTDDAASDPRSKVIDIGSA